MEHRDPHARQITGGCFAGRKEEVTDVCC
jgi:hypothetical protein